MWHSTSLSLTILIIAVGLLAHGLQVPGVNSMVYNAQALFANSVTSVSARVEPNEFNTLAQQLQARETELNERELTLAVLESERQRRSQESNELAIYSLGLSTFLLLLLGLNFYFDYKRGFTFLNRRQVQTNYAVDLSKRQ